MYGNRGLLKETMISFINKANHCFDCYKKELLKPDAIVIFTNGLIIPVLKGKYNAIQCFLSTQHGNIYTRQLKDAEIHFLWHLNETLEQA